MDWFTRNRAIRDAHGYPAVQKVVLFALHTYIHEEGDGAWPSVETLAAACGQCERTTQRALRDLEAAGALIREAPGTYRRTAVYRIAHPLPSRAPLTQSHPRVTHSHPSPDTQGDSQSPQGDSVTPKGDSQSPQGDSVTPERLIERLSEVTQESLSAATPPDTLPGWVVAALPPSPAPAAPEGMGAQVSLPLVAPVVDAAPQVEEGPKGRRKGAPPTLTADEASAWEAAEGVRAAQAVRLRARPYPPPWELAAIRRRLAAGWTVEDFAIVARWFWSDAEAGRRATSDPASTYWRECHDGAYLEAAHRALTQPRVPPVHAARVAWGIYREAVGWARDELPAALGEAIEQRLGYEVAEAVYDAHKVLAWKLRRAPSEVERREVAAEWGADVTARIENSWSVVDRARAAR